MDHMTTDSTTSFDFRPPAFESGRATSGADLGHGGSEREVAGKPRLRTDAFEFLRGQYAELKVIFEEFSHTGSGCVRTRRLLLEDLGEKLENHMRLKEKLLVPLHRKVSDANALQSIEEMALIRALLRRITRLDVTDKSLAPKVRLLEHLVMHHIGSEDDRYLPSIREKHPFENFERLGLRMQEEYRKLQGLHERRLRLREHRRWLAARQTTARQLFGRNLPMRDDLATVTF